MSEELRPCPFCGTLPRANTWIFRGISETRYFCPNQECPLSVRAVTLERWNSRPIEDELQKRIAELEEAIKGHDPFEEFPPKERGFECSVVVLGKFEYEDEFTPFTNWDLCVYWFDEERWHPLNGYVKGDDIVRWYALPPEVQE